MHTFHRCPITDSKGRLPHIKPKTPYLNFVVHQGCGSDLAVVTLRMMAEGRNNSGKSEGTTDWDCGGTEERSDYCIDGKTDSFYMLRKFNMSQSKRSRVTTGERDYRLVTDPTLHPDSLEQSARISQLSTLSSSPFGFPSLHYNPTRNCVSPYFSSTKLNGFSCLCSPCRSLTYADACASNGHGISE